MDNFIIELLSGYVMLIRLNTSFGFIKFIVLELKQTIILVHAKIQTQIDEGISHNIKNAIRSHVFAEDIMMNVIFGNTIITTKKNIPFPFPWLECAAKCNLPFLKLNVLFGKFYQKDFLKAIKKNNFDVIRIFIFIFSPQKLCIDICNIEDVYIRNKLFDIADISFAQRQIMNNGYVLGLPLFLLPILGANQNTTKKVLDLLIKLQKLPYQLFTFGNLSKMQIFYRLYQQGKKRTFVGNHIEQIIMNHIPENYEIFMSICKKNIGHSNSLTIPEKYVIGSLITY